MTWALCFSCGATKFGAICPCPKCNVSSTGDMSLDIAFSDHRLAVETLREFGEVVRAIHRVCEDDDLCFWTFIHYVSTNHPSLLGVNMPPEQQQRCREVLARADPPPVTVREAEVLRWGRDSEEGKRRRESDAAGQTGA
jgi:hypothetical protein